MFETYPRFRRPSAYAVALGGGPSSRGIRAIRRSTSMISMAMMCIDIQAKRERGASKI